MGIEARAILLGPAKEGDLPDIIRADLHELESAEWWRNLQLDGVIMVAWGMHRDTPIARAIEASGTRLVLHIDGSNTHFPFYHRLDTVKSLWRLERDRNPQILKRCYSWAKNLMWSTGAAVIKHSYLKFRHLRLVDVVSCQTPTSVKGHHRLCKLFGGPDHGVKIHLAGSPVPAACKWDPAVPKQKRIIAVGRWDDLTYKRPYLLMEICEKVARCQPDLTIEIFGTKTEALCKWQEGLDPALRDRIWLRGHQPSEVVARGFQEAQVLLVPSSTEGVPLVLFEALACGTTSVAIDSPQMPGARWAAEHHHADLANRDTPESYVAALNQALAKWEAGEYSAKQISDFWRPKTQLESILKGMMEAASEPRNRG